MTSPSTSVVLVMEVSEDIFRDIFVNSDLESDIDFYGFEVSDQDGESESNKEKTTVKVDSNTMLSGCNSSVKSMLRTLSFQRAKHFPFATMLASWMSLLFSLMSI